MLSSKKFMSKVETAPEESFVQDQVFHPHIYILDYKHHSRFPKLLGQSFPDCSLRYGDLAILRRDKGIIKHIDSPRAFGLTTGNRSASQEHLKLEELLCTST